MSETKNETQGSRTKAREIAARRRAAAERALAEAAQRRASQEAAHRAPAPAELGGRNGPEPTRFGDWENKGIAVDF